MAFYKRHLPHWQPEGAEYFITFRLAGSLPVEALNRIRTYQNRLLEQNEPNIKLNIRRKIFQKYENLLDKMETGPTWLEEKKPANVVEEALHFHDTTKYDLYAYCIMPNHVHVVFKHLESKNERDKSNDSYPVTEILHSIKSYSGSECNKILGRTVAFWQEESFDRVIRDHDELENTINYTLNNPVKARLVPRWEDWPHNYCKQAFIETFRTM